MIPNLKPPWRVNFRNFILFISESVNRYFPQLHQPAFCCREMRLWTMLVIFVSVKRSFIQHNYTWAHIVVNSMVACIKLSVQVDIAWMSILLVYLSSTFQYQCEFHHTHTKQIYWTPAVHYSIIYYFILKMQYKIYI